MRTLAQRDHGPRIRAARRKADRTARFFVMAYAMACFTVAALAVTLTL